MKLGGFLLIAIAALELGGCWMGRGLYTTSDARPAIPSGVYQALEPGGSTKTYRISMLPNGLTQVDDGEDKIPYGFSPLDADGRTFVAWLGIDEDQGNQDQDKSEPNQFFGLLVRQASGSFVAYAPPCKDFAARIAHESGALIRTGGRPECRFPSRAALERALRLLPHDSSGMSLTPSP